MYMFPVFTCFLQKHVGFPAILSWTPQSVIESAASQKSSMGSNRIQSAGASTILDPFSTSRSDSNDKAGSELKNDV